jgi:hypothetical protein
VFLCFFDIFVDSAPVNVSLTLSGVAPPRCLRLCYKFRNSGSRCVVFTTKPQDIKTESDETESVEAERVITTLIVRRSYIDASPLVGDFPSTYIANPVRVKPSHCDQFSIPLLSERRMSDTWEHSSSSGSALPREFLVSVEVYVSTAASAALRKVCIENMASVSEKVNDLLQPPIQRKKTDRRDSLKPSASAVDDKKVRGKFWSLSSF